MRRAKWMPSHHLLNINRLCGKAEQMPEKLLTVKLCSYAALRRAIHFAESCTVIVLGINDIKLFFFVIIIQAGLQIVILLLFFVCISQFSNVFCKHLREKESG